MPRESAQRQQILEVARFGQAKLCNRECVQAEEMVAALQRIAAEAVARSKIVRSAIAGSPNRSAILPGYSDQNTMVV